MVDITKYKNVSLPKDTYNTITKLQKVMVPDATISRTQVINILVEKERKKQSVNENKRMGENIRLYLQRLLYC